MYDIDYYVYVDASGSDEPEVEKVVYHKKNNQTINETLWTQDEK